MNILNLLCVRVNLWLMKKEFTVLQYQMNVVGFSPVLADRRAALLTDIHKAEQTLATDDIQLRMN